MVTEYTHVRNRYTPLRKIQGVVFSFYNDDDDDDDNDDDDDDD